MSLWTPSKSILPSQFGHSIGVEILLSSENCDTPMWRRDPFGIFSAILWFSNSTIVFAKRGTRKNIVTPTEMTMKSAGTQGRSIKNQTHAQKKNIEVKPVINTVTQRFSELAALIQLFEQKVPSLWVSHLSLWGEPHQSQRFVLDASRIMCIRGRSFSLANP